VTDLRLSCLVLFSVTWVLGGAEARDNAPTGGPAARQDL